MEKGINAWAAKRAGCKVREPKQNARTHAKCAGPRKVHGLRYESRGRQVHGRARNAWDGGSIARAALSARVAIAWRGEWAALPTHLPRTCHSMPTTCNRGSTRVGRDEPQSPGTLRVNIRLTYSFVLGPCVNYPLCISCNSSDFRTRICRANIVKWDPWSMIAHHIAL